MGTVNTEILKRTRALAQDLRREGRDEDAQVIDELLFIVAQQDTPVQYATTGQVAKRLGVSRQTVVNWIKRGMLPGVKLGSRLVVPASVLGQLEEMERLLDIVDADRGPATTEEMDRQLNSEREQWTWVGKEG